MYLGRRCISESCRQPGRPGGFPSMLYEYLKERGALNEVDLAQMGSLSAASAATSGPTNQLLAGPISSAVVELIPESVARENRIMPLAFDGETIICAAVNPESIGLADKLRFLL